MVLIIPKFLLPVHKNFEKYNKFLNPFSEVFSSVICSQIGKNQMSFTSIDLAYIIKPFNWVSITSLNSNQNSDILIFYINHGTIQPSSDGTFEFFIECLSKMKFSHAIIFNEAKNSGILNTILISSIIFEKLIHLNFKFQETYCTTFISDYLEQLNTEDYNQASAVLYNIIQQYARYRFSLKTSFDLQTILEQYKISESIKIMIQDIMSNIIKYLNHF